MNYEQFCTLWRAAMAEAGLRMFGTRPSEAIELNDMSRTYSVFVTPGQKYRIEPFVVAAELSWRWEAALSARSATTEEDVLVELLGQSGHDLDTEQPWVRVDAKLRATLSMDSPIPMPSADAWRRWVGEVTTHLDPLLPTGEMYQGDPSVLRGRSEPKAHFQCDLDGELYLASVELSAWQGIGVPRQWDDPKRLPDEGTERQLADFAGRLCRALQEWGKTLRYLHPTTG
jgi:hypothetical protein